MVIGDERNRLTTQLLMSSIHLLLLLIYIKGLDAIEDEIEIGKDAVYEEVDIDCSTKGVFQIM